jgi:FAD-dependent urate hydroxylase
MAQGANQALEDVWLLTRALSLPGDPAELLRRYERRRARRVRPVSRLAATERTNRVPHPVVRALAKRVPAGRAYLRLIQQCSSVLNDETP